MESLKINGEIYEIQSIRQVSPGVLEIAFAGNTIPDSWGDMELYTAGGVLATIITGYTTLLDISGNVVQITNGITEFPIPQSNPGTPYYHQLEQEILSARKALEQEQQHNVVLARAATFTAVTFTDEQALQVPELYPVWSPEGLSHKAGERIRYNDVLYKVLTDHTSQESWKPDVSPSLFAKVLIPDPEVIPDWEQPTAENAYMTGDKVKHNGKTWESLVDHNIWEPGVTGTEGQWKEAEE